MQMALDFLEELYTILLIVSILQRFDMYYFIFVIIAVFIYFTVCDFISVISICLN